MGKLRVYELARELKVESKILMQKIAQLGIDVQSHQSTLLPEHVEKIKGSYSKTGGATKTPTAVLKKSSVTTAKAAEEKAPAASTRVIRRRRADPTENLETGVELSSSDETPELTSPPAEEATTPQVETFETAAQAEEMTAPEASAPIEEKAPEIETAASEEEVKSIEVNEPDSPQTQTASAPLIPTPKKKIAPALGATIVRKATPEEQAEFMKQQTRPQGGMASSPMARRNPHTSQQQGGFNRREDSKGVRVTGLGLQPGERFGGQDQRGIPGKRPFPPRSPGERSGTGFSPPAVGGDLGLERPEFERRREKEVVTKWESGSEEEENKNKLSQKQKRINATLNMRALLSQVDEEDTGLDPDIEVPEEVIEKKIYTPSSSARKKDLKRRKDLKKTQITTPRAAYRIVEMEDAISVSELARQMAVKGVDIIKKLMKQGMMVTINAALDFDTATLLASEYGFEVKKNIKTIEDVIGTKQSEVVEGKMETRPPIVTIMGHVDHGKTSILDAIRSANVAKGEFGGITQHIGAYTVQRNGKTIAFLDTPGHEAFSAMRARGAGLTDIVVLVVAADDGVMPQTREAISHAKAANVPIIVAVNKIDKPNQNIERIFGELAELGVQVEEWGGETQSVKVSALKKIGLDELLEAILLQAEVLDLKADSNAKMQGAVVEAHLDKGRGPVATIMVKKGTLHLGDYIIAGTISGKVRAMTNHLGQKQETATPSTPVEIIGLSGVPLAGDLVFFVEDEKTAKEAIDLIEGQARAKAQIKSSAQSLDDLLGKMRTAEAAELPIIVKADTQGSVEAIAESIMKLNTPKVANKIVFKAVGGITESDIQLARATKCVVIGFNTRAQRAVEELAEANGVAIKYFNIIYDVIDAIKALMVGQLPPVVKEVVLGHAKVRQPFSVPKIGTIAGSLITDGKITRSSHLRLIRDDIVIYSGKISSLRRFKDDVKEVAQGYECGIGIDGYQDLREGDVIEAFLLEEHQATLD